MEGRGLIVLLRHGESQLNKENRFSGWSDCPLTSEGIRQAKVAGRNLREAGIGFDACFTSVLSRAVDTASLVLGELGLERIPVTRDWRLNERHYGALEGTSKSEAIGLYGASQVEAWRNSAEALPPPLSVDDPRHPVHRDAYRHLSPEALPSSESLRDAFRRVVCFLEDEIMPLVNSGGRVLVVSHGNPIRGLLAHLLGHPADSVPLISVPNASPVVCSWSGQARVQRDFYAESTR